MEGDWQAGAVVVVRDIREGLVRAELADEIRAGGERVVARIETWEPPFSDGWEKWRPDAVWPLPALPPGWDVV